MANGTNLLKLGLVILSLSLVFIVSGAKCSWKDKKAITGSSSKNWLFIPSTPDTPARRADHTAIWTDSEMIIWGGYNGAVLGTGAKYYQTSEPGGWVTYTSCWTPLASANAPSARYGHTAIWTGTEMLIWGGYNLTDYLYTGARYNPSTDTWNSLFSLSISDARADHTAVWTGNKMIVWGGQNIFGYLHTGGKYTLPPAEGWDPIITTDVPWPRQSHTAVWTGTEMVVWGGSSFPSGYAFDSGGKYNPNTDTWAGTTSTDAPLPRDDHTAIWTGNEMIIWGGYRYQEDGYFNTGARYDPADNWISMAVTDTFLARSGHTAIWTGPSVTPTLNNKMIIWGGHNAGANLNTGAIYSIDTWSAMTTTALPSARYHHTAVWTGSNPATPTIDCKMIIWGGRDKWSRFDTGGQYDPLIDTWTTVTQTDLYARSDHTAVWATTTNEMLIWGGKSTIAEDTGSRYDPIGEVWTPITTTGAPAGRYDHTAVWTGSEMLIWGGFDGITDTLNTGGRYNPVSNSWQPITTTGTPSARYNHTAIWDNANNRMIIWGGYNASSERVFDTGAAYYPITNTWSAIKDASEPISARKDHTAVWTNSEMLVWGGFDGENALNTGAEYNLTGNAWTPITTTGAPSARYHHTAIWTGNEMIIWGGDDGTNRFNDGAKYYPITNTWVSISTIDAPVSRSRHTVIWTGTEMYIWGGLGSAGQPLLTGARYNLAGDTCQPKAIRLLAETIPYLRR